MRTTASENQEAIALLTKDQLWDMLAEAERERDKSQRHAEWQSDRESEAMVDESHAEQRFLAVELNEMKSRCEQFKAGEAAALELLKRPLRDWDSKLLEMIFWSDELTSADIMEMIHVEMNARGEGGKVAV